MFVYILPLLAAIVKGCIVDMHDNDARDLIYIDFYYLL